MRDIVEKFFPVYMFSPSKRWEFSAKSGAMQVIAAVRGGPEDLCSPNLT